MDPVFRESLATGGRIFSNAHPYFSTPLPEFAVQTGDKLKNDSSMPKITLDEFCAHWVEGKYVTKMPNKLQYNVFDFVTLAGDYSRQQFHASFHQEDSVAAATGLLVLPAGENGSHIR